MRILLTLRASILAALPVPLSQRYRSARRPTASGNSSVRSVAEKQRFILPWAILFLCLHSSAVAQVMLLDKAYELAQQKEFIKAREAIDRAATDPATVNEPRTWYLKGYIYKELYKASPAGAENLREAALAATRKSQQLDTKRIYYKDCQAVARFLHVTYYNEAIGEFNQQEYNKALNSLQKYLQARANEPPDELYGEALYFAGYASLELGNKAEATRYYERALQLKYRDPLLYSELSTLYEEAGKDSLALQTVTAGRQQFPSDTTLRVTEINLLLALKKFTKAEKLVEEYLALSPNNVEVMMVAGTIYERVAQDDSLKRELYFNKRRAIYQRALALSPNSFSANYNLGVTLYNRAVDIIKMDDYGIEILVFDRQLENIKVLFQNARPYMEKAHELAPENLKALQALEGIYHNLNEKESEARVRDLIKRMK